MKTNSCHRHLTQKKRTFKLTFHHHFVAIKDSVNQIDISKLKSIVQVLLTDHDPSQSLSTQEYLDNVKEQKTPEDIRTFDNKRIHQLF